MTVSTTKSFVPGFALTFKFALRELRGGLRGFFIFLGCIALGVAAISGVNSVAWSITDGIASQGQAILGGDLSFSLVQQEANSRQRQFLEEKGKITELVTMRAMARKADGSDQTLVELKAIDAQYPNYGTFSVENQSGEQPELSATEVFAESLLFERLALEPGQKIEIGSAQFTLKAAILSEPDLMGEGVGFGPRIIISRAGLEASGLIQPGSLLRYHYKLKLDDPSDTNIKAITQTARKEFPDAGWRIRSRSNAAPALRQSVERFSQFLTLVGLTALIVGGVGVANATRAFLETKRPVIASLKSLGAPGNFIFNLYLLQILAITTIGIVIGLTLGVIMPFAARAALSDLLPVTQGNPIYPAALLPGIAYGYLTAIAFAVWPLAVSRNVQPTDLFRANTYNGIKSWPAAGYLLVLALCIILLVSMAILLADNRYIASVFVGAIAAAFVLLRLVAFAIQYIARKIPSPRSTAWRMAIANIHRPGSLTPSVILSLGLGLALLVALATIDGNLRGQIENNLSDQAPDFFFVDIQNTEIDQFRSKLKEYSPDGKIIAVPMLRGRITSLKGIDARNYKAKEGGEWVLRGDRGITYAKNVPENSTLAEGEWWSEDYTGPPLVSVSAEEAGELGLSVGDEIMVNVLGRSITATIASLRQVQWETLGINFVLVFSPNTFAGAPHSHLATLTSGNNGEGEFDGKLLKGLAKSFPAVTAVRIRDALDTVNTLISQLSTAIRAAASVALIASILVLAGALAAGNNARVHDAVVLKTLGATRKTLMKMLVLEYALLGFATAVFAIFAGSLAAWFVITVIMGFEYSLLPVIGLSTIAVSLAFTIVLGLSGTWRILGQKAAPILREL